MKKKLLILLDRDGVLIYDKKYHLGRQKIWKRKVEILPKVIQGLKLLNKIPDVHIYMVTNQPGVAVKDFPLLTLRRAHEVCHYVLEKLRKKGGFIEGYFVCPHASPKYTKKRSNFKFNNKLVCNCSCIKPRLGMIFNALKAEGITRKNAKIYVVGDRESDIKTALNVKGTGIFVPFKGEPGQIEKVRKLKGKVHIAKNLLDAAKIIAKQNMRS